jgi:hypothetical protein
MRRLQIRASDIVDMSPLWGAALSLPQLRALAQGFSRSEAAMSKNPYEHNAHAPRPNDCAKCAECQAWGLGSASRDEEVHKLEQMNAAYRSEFLAQETQLAALRALAVAVDALRGLASEARGCDNPDFEEDDENGATEVQCSCCAVVSQTARNTLAKLDAMGHGAAQGKANGDGDK